MTKWLTYRRWRCAMLLLALMVSGCKKDVSKAAAPKLFARNTCQVAGDRVELHAIIPTHEKWKDPDHEADARLLVEARCQRTRCEVTTLSLEQADQTGELHKGDLWQWFFPALDRTWTKATITSTIESRSRSGDPELLWRLTIDPLAKKVTYAATDRGFEALGEASCEDEDPPSTPPSSPWEPTPVPPG